MPLCKKLLTARKNGAEKEVGAAFMLNEIQKDANPTPRQTITNYAKSWSREERVIDDILKVELKISEIHGS